MKEKLEYSEIGSLIYFFIRATLIGIGINSYLYFGKVNGYLSIIIGSILGIIPIFIFLKLSNIKKEKNIHQLISYIVGEKIGKMISISLCLFTLFFTVVLFYDCINFIASEYLYKTPPMMISIVILIPIVYLLSKGLKTICRSSIILFFISFALYLVSAIGLIPSFEATNLLPFLEDDMNGVFFGALAHVAYAILPIFILLIIPKDNFKEDSKSIDKKIIITIFLVTMMILLSILDVIGILGIDLANLYQYPNYQVLRRIQVGGFIQRTESILAIQWVLCLFIMIVFCSYYVIKTTTLLIPKIDKNKSKILHLIIPIIVLLLSRILFINNTAFMNFTIKVFPFYIYIFFFFIPLTLYLIYLIKK